MEISWFVYCFIATKHSTVYCCVGPVFLLHFFSISFRFISAHFFSFDCSWAQAEATQKPQRFSGRPWGASNQLLFDGGIHWEEDKHCWPRLRCRLYVVIIVVVAFSFSCHLLHLSSATVVATCCCCCCFKLVSSFARIEPTLALAAALSGVGFQLVVRCLRCRLLRLELFAMWERYTHSYTHIVESIYTEDIHTMNQDTTLRIRNACSFCLLISAWIVATQAGQVQGKLQVLCYSVCVCDSACACVCVCACQCVGDSWPLKPICQCNFDVFCLCRALWMHWPTCLSRCGNWWTVK